MSAASFLRFSIALLVFVGLFHGVAFAQPGNDNCADATIITNLSGGCTAFDNTGATSEWDFSPCGVEGAIDYFFEFTAQGPNVTIDVTGPASSRPEIVIFEASTCATTPVCLAVADQNGNYGSISMNETALLTSGTNYIFAVLSNNDVEASYTVCVTNPLVTPPPNDDCPDAITLTQTTTCSTSNFSSEFGTDFLLAESCGLGPDDDVWFEFTATTTNPVIEVTGGTGYDAVVELLESSDCSSFTIYDCVDGTVGGGLEVINATGLTIGNTYLIRVFEYGATGVTDPTDWTFDICVHDAGTGACVLGSNDDCSNAQTVSVTTGVGDVCVTGCNDGATQGPVFSPSQGCFDLANPTVWYEVTVDASGAIMNVGMTSSDITEPQVAIYQTTDCANYTLIDCNTGNGGNLNALNGITVGSGDTYIIGVSSNNGDVGTFNLCIEIQEDNSACNTNATLVENSSSDALTPMGGPYSPGETVEFCYTINGYGEEPDANCNYLSGIVPTFGDCWDPASFDANGQPLSVTVALATQGFVGNVVSGPPQPCEDSPAGTWSWYPPNSVDYNLNNPSLGYTAGDPITDGGWFFVTNYDSWEAENNGVFDCDNSDHNTPDESYGDFSFPDCPTNPAIDPLTWTVCFEVIALAAPACSGNTDCSLSIRTYADGEVGVWENIGCTADVAQVFNASLDCCIPPVVTDITPEVCETIAGSGVATAVDLTLYNDQINADNPAPTFEWYTDMGLTTLVTDDKNEDVVDGAVYYVVVTDGCSALATVTFTVNPLPTVTDQTIDLCEDVLGGGSVAGESLTALEASIGTGSIMWYSDPALTTTVTTPGNITVLDGDTYYAEVTNTTTGCVDVATVIYNVNPLPTPVITGDLTICPGDPSILDAGLGYAGYQWSTTEATQTISVSDAGTYTVTVTDVNGCTGTAEVTTIVEPIGFTK